MKILKIILYAVGILVLLLVLLGLIGPGSYDVSRSVQIAAPAEIVKPYIINLRRHDDWGPWSRLDTTMQTTYEGEDGTVGAVSRWEGKSGSGEQRISSITDTSLEADLVFYSSWGTSHSKGTISAVPANGSSEVTWGFRGNNNFVSRIFATFMNMDKMAGPMFEEGLDSLKALVERDLNASYDGYQVQVTDFDAATYVAVRSTIPMQGISQFLATHYPRLGASIGRAGIDIAGAPSGLYFTWDEETGTTEMAAAMPVLQAIEVPETEVITLPAGKALMVEHRGPYENTGAAHEAVDAFIKKTGVRSKPPVIEEYVTDPGQEPDPANWLTRIYYLLDQ